MRKEERSAASPFCGTTGQASGVGIGGSEHMESVGDELFRHTLLSYL
jgi:hypothetical protein